MVEPSALPPCCPPMNYTRFAKCREGHMDDRSRLAAAWVLTFVLCVGLFATAYWNLHWGMTPFGG
jgi:hypothetical protein